MQRSTPLFRCLRLFNGLVLATLLLGSTDASAHGELEIRIAGMNRQIESSPGNAQLHLERGELHREHLDWDAAEADYARAAELNPALPRIDVCRALLLSDRGELQAAREAFDQVIARSPNDAEALIGRARVLLRLGQRHAAIADLQQGVKELRTADPVPFRELGEALMAEGKAADALAAIDEGIRKMPVLSLQQYALEIELQRKNFEGAIARLDRIIAGANRKETWLTRRAEVLLMSGKPHEARTSLDDALEAIKLLPARIQQAPPIQQLHARIQTAQKEADARIQKAAPSK